MSGKVAPHIVMIVMLAGLFQSCKHDPVAPPNPPDTTHPVDTTKHSDTTHRTLHITPDSSSSVIHAKVVFTVSAKPVAFPKGYTIAWTIDTFRFSRVLLDTVSFLFNDSGTLIVKAVYIDSTNSRRDSTATTIYIKDTTHKPINPNDTTSHDFTWTETQLPNTYVTETNATGCWVFGPNDIYVLNWYLYHFDGSQWAKASLNNQAPGSLSGSSMFGFTSNDFWIIGGSIMYHWDGTSVLQTRLERTGVWHYPSDGAIHAAWGTSSNDMFFVGDSGTILHFDGTNWMNFPKVTGKALYSVWGVTSNDVWAAGYNTSTGESEVLHYNGASWSKDILSNSGETDRWGIGSVYSCDSAKHKFVAVSGTSILRRTDANGWRNDSLLTLSDHIGMNITGQSANDLIAAGSYGLVLHWNGRSWMRYDQYYAPGNPAFFPRQISMKDGTLCIAGFKTGSSWVLIGHRK